MFARFSHFLVALALVPGGHAQAAALVYGTYYDEYMTGFSCGAGGVNCRLDFSQLPADRLLMVHKISCAATSLGPVTQGTFRVSATAGGAALSRSLVLSPSSQSINGAYATNFREDTHFLVGQGRFPYVQLVFTGVPTNITCTLIGDLVNPL